MVKACRFRTPMQKHIILLAASTQLPLFQANVYVLASCFVGAASARKETCLLATRAAGKGSPSHPIPCVACMYVQTICIQLVKAGEQNVIYPVLRGVALRARFAGRSVVSAAGCSGRLGRVLVPTPSVRDLGGTLCCAVVLVVAVAASPSLRRFCGATCRRLTDVASPLRCPAESPGSPTIPEGGWGRAFRAAVAAALRAAADGGGF